MLSGNALRHQIILPEQQAFYDYWRSQCRENALPSRHDIKPEDISVQLPMTSLVERRPSASGHRYHIRLAGTGFWNLYGAEIQGRHIDELPIGCRVDYWTRVLDQVIETRKPYVGVTKPNTPNGSHMAQFWVRVPLSDNGRDINMILGYDHLVKLSDVADQKVTETKIYA
ncbi:PAS domain-containing protein [Litorimonas sp. RW-G-Af-16]|uniref:PAS domain-containing protein n=1 Tax=Litorimonas sp. RW-G-Af-16 TaxID=3241168 RepID=UPI003AB04586